VYGTGTKFQNPEHQCRADTAISEFLFLMQSPNMLTCIHSVMPTALLSNAAALCRITLWTRSFRNARIRSASLCLEPWTMHEPGASVGSAVSPWPMGIVSTLKAGFPSLHLHVGSCDAMAGGFALHEAPYWAQFMRFWGLVHFGFNVFQTRALLLLANILTDIQFCHCGMPPV
jgi:hypothetical protein